MKKEISLNEYQELACTTMNNNISKDEALTNFALGLTGEAGEVADIIKKSVFHGHTLDRNDLIKELGDVMWYIAAMAYTLDVGLEEIASKNIDKLKKRYPEGFDKNKSINRVENGMTSTYTSQNMTIDNAYLENSKITHMSINSGDITTLDPQGVKIKEPIARSLNKIK